MAQKRRKNNIIFKSLESKIKKLSIVIPVFNEKNTILSILARVEEANVKGLEKEIIIVDDCSGDGTRGILKGLENKHKIIYHEKNQGKGAALKNGFTRASGDLIIIQDADLEYDPADYELLIDPICEGKADVVYGCRFRGNKQRVFYFHHYAGNRFLTLLSNIFTNLNLHDMETGYKVFRSEVVHSFKDKLKSKRFGIEPEITARVAKGDWRVYEVPINYYGRSYAEGKKIGWRDGIKAIFCIFYFNLFSR